VKRRVERRRHDGETRGRVKAGKENDAMKLARFSFKAEPMWILIFSLGPAVLGFLFVLVLMLIRRFW
jgi:hypothetical protein